MRQIFYKGFPIYVWGEPVKGYGWNVWYGVNSGASIGMDDYGNRIMFTAKTIPYGVSQ